MTTQLYDPNARKKPTNLSLNSDLLRQAKELRINLSQTLERCLAQMLLDEKQRAWREENRKAIDAYNRRIEEKGVFSNDFRGF
jgi:antitoxin CcdA